MSRMPATNSSISSAPTSQDIIKILVATDIHLGYGEKNPVKADDSYNTFEEILQIGVNEGVDMVLLSGDLFHENKPSRLAEKRCISILRKYVLGDRPVELELLSDPNVNFSHCDEEARNVNYLNPNMNIGLPIFSIHGNHDDPVGLGGLSALDNLHATGLVNYFGRINDLKEITVTPLLFRKGTTKLAMYGLSSVKDERLHRLFRESKVHMLRPVEETDEWFNLLALHQNRVKHGATNYLPEHFIDGFFDLVIWGHEHECRLTPERVFYSNKKEFHISQPGSSVATSLCEGEAVEKQVGILEIHKGRFKMTEKKLNTIRPLIFRTIFIEDEVDLKGTHLSDEKITEKIDFFLRSYVEKLLREEVPPLLTGHSMQPKLPLVRIRVEYRDERHQLAVGRFGNHFQDKIANPSEILLFRKVVERKDKMDGYDLQSDLMDSILKKNLASCSSMEDLIGKYFYQTDEKTQLQLLGVKSVGAAVKAFIQKDDKDAINFIVENQVMKISKALIAADFNDEEIDDELVKFRVKRMAESKNDQAEEEEANQALDDQVTRKASKARNSDKSMSEFNEDDEEMEVEDGGWMSNSAREPTPRGRGRGSRASASAARGATSRGRGRGRGKPSVSDDDEYANGNSTSRGSRASPTKAARAGRASRGGRGAKAPVISTQQSIASAFAKQSQTAVSRHRKPINYGSSDSD